MKSGRMLVNYDYDYSYDYDYDDYDYAYRRLWDVARERIRCDA